MNENYIIIENVDEKDVETVLMNLANLYSKTDYVNGIQLYRKKNKRNSFLILFTNQPDFERFNYFVNYLRYPEGYENFKSFLRGFFRTTELKENYSFNVGDWLMIYVAENDTEYDNISLINEENETYIYSFSGNSRKVNNIENRFKLITFDKNDYHHLIDIIPEKTAKKLGAKKWWKFW